MQDRKCTYKRNITARSHKPLLTSKSSKDYISCVCVFVCVCVCVCERERERERERESSVTQLPQLRSMYMVTCDLPGSTTFYHFASLKERYSATSN